MNSNYQILFERYFNNALNEEELKSFNERLHSDSEFKDAFELFKKMQSYLIEKNMNADALNILREVHNEKTTESSNNSRIKYLVASLLIVGLLLLMYIVKNSNQANKSSHFAEIITEPNWPESRGETSEVESLVIQYRKNQDLDILERIKRSDNIQAFSKYYWLSEIYIHEQQVDSSLKYIKLSQRQFMGIYRDRLLYLEALAYLLNKDAASLNTLRQNLPTDMDKFYRDKIKGISIAN